MLKKIKSFAAETVRNTVEWLAMAGAATVVPKSLMIVKLDGIGDYVLFRNFIEILRKDERYKGYKFTLCASLAVKSLACETERDTIDEFIWVDNKRFYSNYFYRFRVLRDILRKGFEIVIHPTYSREYIADKIVKASKAPVRIGNAGDSVNVAAGLKAEFDGYYTGLVNTESDGRVMKFEFHRYKIFFETLLNKKIDIARPFINLAGDGCVSRFVPDADKPYAVVFPGAMLSDKRWSHEYFAEVCDFLAEKYSLTVLIAGAKSDEEFASKIIEKSKSGKAINIAGKTKLFELAALLAKASVLVSNDTCAVHIGAAVDMPGIVCVFKGNHFGRFVPYPPEVFKNLHCVFPQELEKNINNYEYLERKYLFGSELDINSIAADKVKKMIAEIMGRAVK